MKWHLKYRKTILKIIAIWAENRGNRFWRVAKWLKRAVLGHYADMINCENKAVNLSIMSMSYYFYVKSL